MPASPPWAPLPAAVAQHLKDFARDRVSGEQQDDFSANSRLSPADVYAAIAAVTGDVAGAVGTVPADLEAQAASVVALGAAAEAVIDVAPDLHDRLQRLYESRLTRLRTAVADASDGTVHGGATVPATWSGPEPFGVTRAHW